MQIKTPEQLLAYIREAHPSGNIVLVVASGDFGKVVDLKIDPNFEPPYLAFDIYVDKLDVDRELSLRYYSTSLKGIPRSRSLLDMNVPENGYNDWKLFTTIEEAEEYSRSARSSSNRFEIDREYTYSPTIGHRTNKPMKCIFYDTQLRTAILHNDEAMISVHDNELKEGNFIPVVNDFDDVDDFDQFASYGMVICPNRF